MLLIVRFQFFDGRSQPSPDSTDREPARLGFRSFRVAFFVNEVCYNKAENILPPPRLLGFTGISHLMKSSCVTRVVLSVGWLLAMGANLLAAGVLRAAEVSFNRDIKPLLSENCFTCHGPDEATREGGFRLDLRDSAIAQADSGEQPINPGQASSSSLLARILSTDHSTRMPPASTGKRLTAEQIERIKNWIENGAEYQEHWAFLPPQRGEVPETGPWAQGPLDHFIQARLRQEGVSPNPPADRQTLIRRVTLDLTGLPPTPEEVADFLADDSPEAYEKVVDRLLASPHYGERMALPWLDQARYADSNGYQSDGSREMWAWRDWVIRAFNENMPFDQFTIEQLAGDMLPEPTSDQIIATGFNRNHRLNGEGGRIVDEWFVETVIDRVETTGLVWLGLTMNCCRCHDHKYDPISQREFYQMFAYFNSVAESGVLATDGKVSGNTPPVLELPTEPQLVEESRLAQELEDLQDRLVELTSQLPGLTQQWAAQTRRRIASDSAAGTWSPLEVSVARSLKGATLERLEDDSYLVGGKNPGNDVYEVTAPIEGTLSGLLLEVLPHENLPTQSLGRGFNGNFVLTDVRATITSPTLDNPQEFFLQTTTADFSQPGWPAQSILGDRPQPGKRGANRKGWAIEGLKPENRVPRKLLLLSDQPTQLPPEATLTITMRHESPFADHNVGRFRFSITSLPPADVELSSGDLPPQIVAAIGADTSERTESQFLALQAYYRENVANPLKEVETEIAQVSQELTALRRSFVSTMVMREGKTRDAFILNRGEYDQPGEKVGRGLPAALSDGTDPQDRLELARWIASPRNPLTARVWVNRTWERFFGTGIVKTTENLGSQADYPSHPELLDWLAVEFMDPSVMPQVGGSAAVAWDMKAFQKMLVTSSTYRQSSHVTAEHLTRDPENRLLARGPRFRLAGELVRDAALAVSGLLVPEIGGPSTRPYMPAGVWDETSKYGNLRNYQHEKGDGLYRRSMYTIWKRTAAPPTMLLFDAPNRETCTVQRSGTNTPLQALALLNEVTFVEASRALAVRMLTQGGDTPEARIGFGFQLAVARIPTESELQILIEGLERDIERFADDEESAQKLVALGESAVGRELPARQLAAYTLTANILLNLDEFVMRE